MDNFIESVTTILVTVAHASIAYNKPKVELDSHADTCVVGHNSSVIHDHNRPVNVYNPKDGYRSDKTVDVTVGYKDPQSGQKDILMINQAIHISDADSNLLCPMQCYLNVCI